MAVLITGLWVQLTNKWEEEHYRKVGRKSMNEEVNQLVEETTETTNVNTEETASTENSTDTQTTETPIEEENKVDEQSKEEEATKELDKSDEPDYKLSEEVEGLKSEITRLQGELDASKNNTQTELGQIKEQYETGKQLVSEYESILTSIVDSKLKEVPDGIKQLMPEKISIKEKLEWLDKAEKSGILKQINPDIEIGKPLSPNNSKQQADVSKLSASALLSMAYGSTKSK